MSTKDKQIIQDASAIKQREQFNGIEILKKENERINEKLENVFQIPDLEDVFQIPDKENIFIFYGNEYIFININNKLIKFLIKQSEDIINFINSLLNTRESIFENIEDFNKNFDVTYKGKFYKVGYQYYPYQKKDFPSDVNAYYEPDLGYLSINISSVNITLMNKNIQEMFNKLNDNFVFSRMKLYSSKKELRRIRTGEYYVSPDEFAMIFRPFFIGDVIKEYEQIKNYSDEDLENYFVSKYYKHH